MKKIFDYPEITVSVFSSEDIVTTSVLTPGSVKDMLGNESSGIKLDNQTITDSNKIISFVL